MYAYSTDGDRLWTRVSQCTALLSLHALFFLNHVGSGRNTRSGHRFYISAGCAVAGTESRVVGQVQSWTGRSQSNSLAYASAVVLMVLLKNVVCFKLGVHDL